VSIIYTKRKDGISAVRSARSDAGGLSPRLQAAIASLLAIMVYNPFLTRRVADPECLLFLYSTPVECLYSPNGI
jgi:hypothetical protein